MNGYPSFYPRIALVAPSPNLYIHIVYHYIIFYFGEHINNSSNHVIYISLEFVFDFSNSLIMFIEVNKMCKIYKVVQNTHYPIKTTWIFCPPWSQVVMKSFMRKIKFHPKFHINYLFWPKKSIYNRHYEYMDGVILIEWDMDSTSI